MRQIDRDEQEEKDQRERAQAAPWHLKLQGERNQGGKKLKGINLTITGLDENNVTFTATNEKGKPVQHSGTYFPQRFGVGEMHIKMKHKYKGMVKLEDGAKWTLKGNEKGQEHKIWTWTVKSVERGTPVEN